MRKEGLNVTEFLQHGKEVKGGITKTTVVFTRYSQKYCQEIAFSSRLLQAITSKDRKNRAVSS